MKFTSRSEHRAFLAAQARMPQGFRAATTSFPFGVEETAARATMQMALVVPNAPCEAFAGVFTKNALPGAPILLGRARMKQTHLSALVVNNKIANVAAPGGLQSAQRVCEAVGAALRQPAESVMPASTGVIGWRLPQQEMCTAVPDLVAGLQSESLLPVAEAIMTTDLYPKVRAAQVASGRIVGVAKGAGMVEPNLATMLAYVFTDLQVDRTSLQEALQAAVADSFNAISVDSDTSTSDMVMAYSSGAVPCSDVSAFRAGLLRVCQNLAHDIVRNGEGVHHVLRVAVKGAPSTVVARGLGKTLVNSPLIKTAICGNDPNLGRLIAAVGRYIGSESPSTPLDKLRISFAGIEIFLNGTLRTNTDVERQLAEHLRATSLYESQPDAQGRFVPPADFPVHEETVDIEVDLGCGGAEATTLGGDLSHEYVTENADYRS